MNSIMEEALWAYSYVALWIGLSAGVIMYNKYVLSFFGFPFPVALTMIHMAFCSAMVRGEGGVWGGVMSSCHSFFRSFVHLLPLKRRRLTEVHIRNRALRCTTIGWW